jgi:hypothetical protein
MLLLARDNKLSPHLSYSTLITPACIYSQLHEQRSFARGGTHSGSGAPSSAMVVTPQILSAYPSNAHGAAANSSGHSRQYDAQTAEAEAQDIDRLLSEIETSNLLV